MSDLCIQFRWGPGTHHVSISHSTRRIYEASHCRDCRRLARRRRQPVRRDCRLRPPTPQRCMSYTAFPDLPVDVYVNGALTLDDFQPETVAGPLDLPAGSYEVAITAADAADASSPLLTAKADLAGGNSYSLVAHLDADGNPTITPYANDISTISAGQTRLVVRHDAAAPAVDVRAGGTVVLAGVTNPAEGVLNIPAGTVTPMWCSPAPTPWRSGRQVWTWRRASATFVHAVGSASGRHPRAGVVHHPGPAFRPRRRPRRHRTGRLPVPTIAARRPADHRRRRRGRRWTPAVLGALALTESGRAPARKRPRLSRHQAATGLVAGLASSPPHRSSGGPPSRHRPARRSPRSMPRRRGAHGRCGSPSPIPSGCRGGRSGPRPSRLRPARPGRRSRRRRQPAPKSPTAPRLRPAHRRPPHQHQHQPSPAQPAPAPDPVRVQFPAAFRRHLGGPYRGRRRRSAGHSAGRPDRRLVPVRPGTRVRRRARRC